MRRDSSRRAAGGLLLLPVAMAFALWGAGCGQSNGSDPVGGGGAGRGASSSGASSSSGTSGSSGASGSGGTSSRSGSSGASGSGGGSDHQGASDDDGGAGGDGSAGDDGGASGDGGTGTSGSCLDGITDYEDAGPFTYTATASGSVKIGSRRYPPAARCLSSIWRMERARCAPTTRTPSSASPLTAS